MEHPDRVEQRDVEYLEIWHNRKRRHSQLGWLSPIEFERNRIITVA
ncbi:MAG: IS3 family transposase [Nocardioides sp.]